MGIATSSHGTYKLDVAGSVNITGSYKINGVDLSIPTAQINSDWTATTGLSVINNKPPLLKGDKGDNGTNGKGWTGATYSSTTG